MSFIYLAAVLIELSDAILLDNNYNYSTLQNYAKIIRKIGNNDQAWSIILKHNISLVPYFYFQFCIQNLHRILSPSVVHWLFTHNDVTTIRLCIWVFVSIGNHCFTRKKKRIIIYSSHIEKHSTKPCKAKNKHLRWLIVTSEPFLRAATGKNAF